VARFFVLECPQHPFCRFRILLLTDDSLNPIPNGEPVRQITVHSRLGEKQGVTDGVGVIFEHFHTEAKRTVRHYVLLDKSVKLMFEPWTVKNHWYVDLIQVEELNGNTIQLTDLYVDVWVKGNGPTYEMMDIHELGEALARGDVTAEQMRKPLANLQKFLDNHLNFGAKDYPPDCIKPFMEGDFDDLL
jgi:hypothetical protein